MEIEFTSAFGFFFQFFMLGLAFLIPVFYVLKIFLGFGVFFPFLESHR